MTVDERDDKMAILLDAFQDVATDKVENIDEDDLVPVDGMYLDCDLVISLDREQVEEIVGEELSDELFGDKGGEDA